MDFFNVTGNTDHRNKLKILVKDVFHHLWKNVVNFWNPVQYLVGNNNTGINNNHDDDDALSSQKNINDNANCNSIQDDTFDDGF